MKELGIDVTSVSATAEHELGIIVDDPRGGVSGSMTRRYNTNGIGTETTAQVDYFAPGKRYIYVRADAAIAQYDACEMKLDETDAPFAVIKTASAASKLFGICEFASVDANDYFWLTIEGWIPIANVADASAQGDYLSPSATAGRLDSTALIAGDARCIAVTDGNASNNAGVYLFH
jgi:hypothetical protein